MAGCFGLLDAPHHQGRIPLNRLVEAHRVADVFKMARQHRIQGDQIQLGMDGGYQAGQPVAGKSQTVRLGWHEQPGIVAARIAFVCPHCSKLCTRLHCVNERWACRRCHRLDYLCRHKQRTVPKLARAKWIRQRLAARYGVSGELFASIAPRPLSHRRFWRLALELREIEAGLVQYLSEDIRAVLERRDEKKRSRS
jgi:hypothetical protein